MLRLLKIILIFLEQDVNTQQYQVILTQDFNVPNYNWFNGTPLPDTHNYSKIKGNLFHVTTCFLGLK
jgi:hypothetical protein